MRILLLLGCVTGLAGAQTPLEVVGVPEGAPFKVSASATERVLVVELFLEPEWHAYSRDVGGGQPVALALTDESSFLAEAPSFAPDSADGVLTGEVEVRVPLIPSEGHEPREISARLELQVCDALECLPPTTLEISGIVVPLKALLVVAEEGERADRIAGWLDGRGFAPTVTTYAEVTAEACAAVDVVIADSDVFRKHGVDRQTMHGFPRTETSIVAVGFIGTELVEAHGLAMTSGYI